MKVAVLWDDDAEKPSGKVPVLWDEEPEPPPDGAGFTWDTKLADIPPPPEPLAKPPAERGVGTVAEMTFAPIFEKIEQEKALKPGRKFAEEYLGKQPPPGPEALQPIIQPAIRASVGVVGAANEMLYTIGNLATMGLPPNPAQVHKVLTGQGPFRFSGREFVRDYEKLNILTQANFVERTAQYLGEGAVDIGAIASGAAALQAAGAAPTIANAVSVIGATILGSQAQATAERRPFSVKDFAQSTVFMAAAMPVGKVLGDRIVKTAEQQMKREIGRRTKEVIQNSSMATAFEVQGFASGDPEWKERWLAGALTFNLVSAHEAMYQGETRPRTPGAVKQSVEATAKLLEERGVGLGPNPPPDVQRMDTVGESTPADKANSLAMARAYAENSQVPYAQGEARPATAADLVDIFGLDQADAERIANRKLTQTERTAIEEARAEEAVAWEANRRGGPDLADETAYQRGTLPPEQRAAYETRRATFSPERLSELQEQVPRPEDAVARAAEAIQEPAPEPEIGSERPVLARRPPPAEAEPVQEATDTRAAVQELLDAERPVDGGADEAVPAEGEGKTATAEPPAQPAPSPETRGEPIPAQSILERATGRAKSMLGEKADETPGIDPALRADYERRLEKAADRAYRRLKETRAGLSTEELGMLGAGALALGSYVGSQAAQDDETREKWAMAAGIPAIFFMGRGRKLDRSARAEAGKVLDAKIAERTTAMDDAVGKLLRRPIGSLIYKGKATAPGALRASKEIFEGLAKLPTGDIYRKDRGGFVRKTSAQIVRTATGTLKQMGQSGNAFGRLIEDAQRVRRMREMDWSDQHNRMDTGVYGDRPNRMLSPKEETLLDDTMDWMMDHSLPKPDMEAVKKGSPKFQRELAIAIYRQFDQLPTDPARAKAVVEGAAWYDAAYADWLDYAQKAGQFVQPLYTNGHYWPVHHRDAVLMPSETLKRIPTKRAEYFERVADAEARQKAIVRQTGIPLVHVKEALRGEKQHGAFFWRRRPVEDVIAKRASSLDYHRVFNTPIGGHWSPSRQFMTYIESAPLRVEFVRRFGVDAEVADALLTAAEREGYDRMEMAELVDRAMEQSPRYVQGFESWYGKSLGTAKSLIYLGSLGRFVHGQFTQMVSPMMSAGHGPAQSAGMTLKNWPKALGGAISTSADLPEGIRKRYSNEAAGRLAAKAGVLIQAVHLQDTANVRSPLGRLVNMELKFQLGTLGDRTARVLGAVVGDEWFRLLHEERKNAFRRGDTKKQQENQQLLEEIFQDEPELVKQALRTDLDAGEMEYLSSVAAQTISDRWNHHVAPSTMPLMYSHPVGNSFYTLGTFAYKQTATFHRAMENFRKYPATRRRIAAAVLPMTGMGMLTGVYLRRFGQDTDADDPFWQDVVNGAAYAWFAPLYVDAYKEWTGQYGNPVKSTMGPIYGTALDLGDAYLWSRKQGSADPLLKTAVRKFVPLHPVPGLPQPREKILEEIGDKKRKRRRLKAK